MKAKDKNKDKEKAKEVEVSEEIKEEAAATEAKAESGEKQEKKEKNEKPEKKESGEEKLAAMLEEAKDKFLRKAAEFDNFKKRTAREKTENFTLGLCGAVEKLLPVLDNLDRAIGAAEGNDDKDALLEGIKMVRSQFVEALGALNVSEIEAVGREFDPELHNAVMTGESDEPSNTITDEFAKGYIYKSGDSERVIRHSMVKVAT